MRPRYSTCSRKTGFKGAVQTTRSIHFPMKNQEVARISIKKENHFAGHELMTWTIVHDVSTLLFNILRPTLTRVIETRGNVRLADTYPILVAIPLKSMKPSVIKRVCHHRGSGCFSCDVALTIMGGKRVPLSISRNLRVCVDELLVIVLCDENRNSFVPFRGLPSTCKPERDGE